MDDLLSQTSKTDSIFKPKKTLKVVMVDKKRKRDDAKSEEERKSESVEQRQRRHRGLDRRDVQALRDA